MCPRGCVYRQQLHHTAAAKQSLTANQQNCCWNKNRDSCTNTHFNVVLLKEEIDWSLQLCREAISSETKDRKNSSSGRGGGGGGNGGQRPLEKGVRIQPPRVLGDTPWLDWGSALFQIGCTTDWSWQESSSNPDVSYCSHTLTQPAHSHLLNPQPSLMLRCQWRPRLWELQSVWEGQREWGREDCTPARCSSCITGREAILHAQREVNRSEEWVQGVKWKAARNDPPPFVVMSTCPNEFLLVHFSLQVQPGIVHETRNKAGRIGICTSSGSISAAGVVVVFSPKNASEAIWDFLPCVDFEKTLVVKCVFRMWKAQFHMWVFSHLSQTFNIGRKQRHICMKHFHVWNLHFCRWMQPTHEITWRVHESNISTHIYHAGRCFPCGWKFPRVKCIFSHAD